MDHIFPFPSHRSKLMRLPKRKYETDAILGPIYLTNVLLYLLSVSSNQLYRSSLEYNLLLWLSVHSLNPTTHPLELYTEGCVPLLQA